MGNLFHLLYTQYSLQELVVGSNLNNFTLAFIKSLSCYLDSSLHLQASGSNFFLRSLFYPLALKKLSHPPFCSLAPQGNKIEYLYIRPHPLQQKVPDTVNWPASQLETLRMHLYPVLRNLPSLRMANFLPLNTLSRLQRRPVINNYKVFGCGKMGRTAFTWL
jgi:hypothetical protein